MYHNYLYTLEATLPIFLSLKQEPIIITLQLYHAEESFTTNPYPYTQLDQLHHNLYLHTLQQLRHENLVNLIEVFRRKKRLYLVFEFVDHTALDDLEKYPMGAEEGFVKKIMWQVIKGVEFCHSHNVSTRANVWNNSKYV